MSINKTRPFKSHQSETTLRFSDYIELEISFLISFHIVSERQECFIQIPLGLNANLYIICTMGTHSYICGVDCLLPNSHIIE